MLSWLIPANTKFYDVFAAFQQTEIYWPMNARIAVGDTVYLYLAAPYKQIGFVCEALETGHNLADIHAKVAPFIKGDANAGPDGKPFMKLRLSRVIPIENDCAFSLHNLRAAGLNGMLMGARKLDNNPALFDYVKGHCMSFDRSFEAMLALDGVEASTMMKTPCLRYKGNFLAMMFEKQEALIIKVSPERVTELIAEGAGMEFNFTKKRFREWVLIPLEFQDKYGAYMNEALEYAKKNEKG